MNDNIRAELLELVRSEAFKTDPKLTVEENALNFAIKVFLFATTGEKRHAKTSEDAR